MSKPFRLPWHKRALSQPWVQQVATFLVSLVLRLLLVTYRVNVQMHDQSVPYMRGDRQAIFCFWHGRMLLLPFYRPKNRGMHMLISHHRDGELIARLVKWLGVDAVRGSSSRGVRSAVDMMFEHLTAGDNVGITPDGPRGPAQKASRGAVHMAQRVGVDMLPVAMSASRAWRLKSWDRFMIPKPFARVVIGIDAPMVASELAEDARSQLEERLNAITDEMDQLCHA